MNNNNYNNKNNNKIFPIRTKKELPKKLKIGYTNWYEVDEKIYESVENGINIIIWFSIDLISHPETKKPFISRGLNYEKLSKITKKIKENNYNVINLISIGGWNSPHLDISHSAEEYFKAFLEFNKNISNNFFDGFDGIDWDIEGNDDLNSKFNYFSYEELNLIGEISKLFHENNFIVSMAPAESYLDYTNSNFNLSLKNNYSEWEKINLKFNYHGNNCYAYIISKFGLEIFDFVSIQLYEGYSHALFRYLKSKEKIGKIFEDLIVNLEKGFYVNFEFGKKLIKINKEKIVIGIANGWANEIKDKFLFINEDDLIEGIKYLKDKNIEFRGFMFWNIFDEGKIVQDKNGNKKKFYLSKIINNI